MTLWPLCLIFSVIHCIACRFCLIRLHCTMHIAHGATQSIDNGLDTNQGSLLPDSLVIQISPFSLSHQKLASLSRNESFVEKITFSKCVWPINPTIYLLMPMKIHSLIERTIINLQKVPLRRNPKKLHFSILCHIYR